MRGHAQAFVGGVSHRVMCVDSASARASPPCTHAVRVRVCLDGGAPLVLQGRYSCTPYGSRIIKKVREGGGESHEDMMQEALTGGQGHCRKGVCVCGMRCRLHSTNATTRTPCLHSSLNAMPPLPWVCRHSHLLLPAGGGHQP